MTPVSGADVGERKGEALAFDLRASRHLRHVWIDGAHIGLR